LLLEETFAPKLLTIKAVRLRHMTGNWALHAKHEEVVVDMGAFVTRYLSRPLVLLFTEPLISLISIPPYRLLNLTLI
jgi:DHA1 family multidrug resistance protein-like MFS transporter